MQIRGGEIDEEERARRGETDSISHDADVSIVQTRP